MNDIAYDYARKQAAHWRATASRAEQGAGQERQKARLAMTPVIANMHTEAAVSYDDLYGFASARAETWEAKAATHAGLPDRVRERTARYSALALADDPEPVDGEDYSEDEGDFDA